MITAKYISMFHLKLSKHLTVEPIIWTFIILGKDIEATIDAMMIKEIMLF